MTIHVGLTHTTTYSYDRTIRLAPHTVRLRPAPHTRTPIFSYALKVTPERHFINWQQDPFGNYLARFVFPERTDRFEVVVDLTASMTAIDPFDFFLEEEAEDVPFTYDDKLKQDLAPYLTLDAAREIEAFRSLLPEQNMSTVDYFVTVNQRVYEEIAYVIRMEPGVQTPAQTLALKKGSCRDSAWLLANLLRLEGYATRFVSGYLIQLTADEKAIGGPQGPAADFTDLHAWCEVYAPGAGWIGLDPTSGLFTGEGHIPLAATPLPGSAAPIEGAHEAAEVAFDFSMKVDRIYEAPRVSKPYTEEEWRRIDAVGQAVDARLEEGDVRLTMGGEPTFVAADDFDADEWNIEAVGPTKRRYADDLARRLQKRFAPGGAIQHGDGKWYPGEPLPRWAFSVFWRTDGAPVWENDEFIAREDAPSSIGAEDVRRFSESLCAALELEPDYAQAIYEDPAEYLLRERKLAPDIDPRDNRLESPEDRARLGKIFDRGLTTPAGFVIPLYQSYEPTPYPQQPQARDGGRRRAFRWRSERWRTRRGALFLLPGDSAAGFRLPLRSLAYVDPDAAPSPIPLDPFAPRGPLPPRLQRRVAPAAETEPGWRPIDGEMESDAAPIAGGVPGPRTAFALEERDGVLCVFFPPVESADAFMDLLAAVEETATDLAIPVRLEGYPPPPDYRIQSVKVTPDPGVIEVNVQPGPTWAEQRAITETLYEEARGVGLTAAKFMPDGRPVGSGGGNHIVVGGATPADSPFLRRPDLLGSIVRYWQNHPSLSYLFSGLFIGPTSQAPRVDEARPETLYELDIALAQIPDPAFASGTEAPPWLVDRIFRHLLTDVSGNTHRSEICIDKLYSPDGPTGRLGLVEFRGFEMPPHARMSLAQQLLLRGLIAWFWERPYQAPLQPFGLALHDKYLLPHHIWADFKTVLADVSSGLGLTFEESWFAPQFEFRFPLLGDVQHGDISLQFRAAIEPWNVLGEEATGGGVARFVDNSLERLEVKAAGHYGDRYAVACNGVALPFHATADNGEQVAGVRFRAWQPPSCLHPTIAPHTPLVFDVVDRYSGRSIGGCTYYAEHPGGRNPETRPVNALEAQGRRQARFARLGHTPGPFRLREPRLTPDSTYTLDMRRNAL